MRFRKPLSAILAAAMLSSVAATVGAVDASADEAKSVDTLVEGQFDTYPTYAGNDLGANYTPEATTFKVWAPSSSNVSLRLYTTGSDKEEGAELIKEVPMTVDKSTGVWSCTVEGDQKSVYYTYDITNSLGEEEVVDIYAKAAGVNGNRAMVVDLDSTDPAGWDSDKHVLVDSPTQAMVWEIHVKDFSYDPESGVSEQYRGKYMAFTELQTTLNNAGDVKTCMNYLKDLGINYVQINPMYDFASVKEDTADDTQFNWGYDPKNYNVPEGSYSTNPYDGNVRINEMKTMIKTLHDNGIGVIMDVVYNHTFDSGTSWFNLTVPDYYYRQDSNGGWSNGSGCGNDTASEREMFKKFMVDSVTYWAEEYHIDGFRFDLMGLHDCDTMDAVRESLDSIDTRILTYGEGWVLGTYTDRKNWAGNKTSLCIQAKAKKVSPRIGFFNDDIRDRIKGKAFDDLTSPGFASGVGSFANAITESMIGHFTTSNWKVAEPGQNVVYSCCHDNQTLWDRFVASEYGIDITDDVYARRSEKFVAGNKLAETIVMTSQGISFFLAGEEFCRTKYGDHNSYKSSPDLNMLDWSRASDYADVVSYFKGLVQIRKAFPGFADSTLTTGENIEQLKVPDGVVGLSIPNMKDSSGKTWSKMIVLMNGSRTSDATVSLGGGATGDVDGDGSVTSSDALSILRHSTEVAMLDDAQVANADLDGDGVITSADAFMALRISLGLADAPTSGAADAVEYSVIADDQTAGITELRTVSGSVKIPPCSALILVPKADYDKADLGAQPAEAKLIVNHIDKASGKTFYTTTMIGSEGQGYSTLPAGDLALEYDLDSIDGAASGKLTKGTTTVNYYYTLYPGGIGTVTVNYVNADGKSLSDPIVMKARAGDDYTTSAKSFAWYSLDGVPLNATGKFTGGETEVTYVYNPVLKSTTPVESTIHVRVENASFVPNIYLWELYNESTGNMDANIGAWPGVLMEDSDNDGWYDIKITHGGGYDWILNEEGSVQTADMFATGDIWVVANGSAKNVTVTEYDPDGPSPDGPDMNMGKLVVRHLDEEGKEITKTISTKAEGTAYKAEPMDNKWYVVDETKLPDNAEGTYTNGETEVVFYYKAAPTNKVKVHVAVSPLAKTQFTPYLYFWETKTEEVKWPGVKLTDPDDEGWYTYELETADTFFWIINDGNGTQTKDFESEATDDLWIVATSASSVKSYTEKPDLPKPVE